MRPNIGRTILGGFVGTLAITLLMYKGAPMMGLVKMDIAAMLGQVLGGWTTGMMMHIVNGVVMPSRFLATYCDNPEYDPRTRGDSAQVDKVSVDWLYER